MPSSSTIDHALPQIGLVHIPLYEPADRVASDLNKNNEKQRLIKLRHLGALSHALPGARQARWDYTVALLYYADKLEVRGSKTSFRIGRVKFSSLIAALQTLALTWNVGHVPGTFAVEKGIYRYLRSVRSETPTGVLDWPHDDQPEVQRIKKEANRLLKDSDYLGVARVLGVIKCLQFAKTSSDFWYFLVTDVIAPTFLDYRGSHSSKWVSLMAAFGAARHLAYLTLDSPISGLQWGPTIPALVDHELSKEGHSTDVQSFADTICELLSPIERMTFATIYHRRESRKEAAVISKHIEDYLSAHPNPAKKIGQWLRVGLLRDLKCGKLPSRSGVNLVASIRFRNHFSAISDSPSNIETSLADKGLTHSIALRYPAWNSSVMLEPDEFTIDAITRDSPTCSHVGYLILWVISRFEDFRANKDDIVQFFVKSALDPVYRSLIARTVELMYSDTVVEFTTWPLDRFGIFSDEGAMETIPVVWASNARLDDPIISYVVRDRKASVPTELSDAYAELLGIRELRRRLRVGTKKSPPRVRWLVVTGSVKFRRDGRDLIEYDGALLKISARTGQVTWYGLETKSRRGNPAHALRRRLKVLSIDANIVAMNRYHAYAEIPFS